MNPGPEPSSASHGKGGRTFWAACGWSALVVGLHMLPRAQIDSNSVTRELARSTWFDKVVHATMFGVAVLLWSKALPGRRARWVFAASGVLAGTALEFLQHYSVRGRTGSLDDLLADAAGIAVVLIFLESRRNTL